MEAETPKMGGRPGCGRGPGPGPGSGRGFGPGPGPGMRGDAYDGAANAALGAGEADCDGDRDVAVSEEGPAPCDRFAAEKDKPREGRAGELAASAAPLKLAVGLGSRMKGLLMAQPDGDSLLLAPCNDVHTVGMRHPLDIAFVDQTGLVLEVFRDVGPRRRLRNRKAVAVVERFSACGGPWIEPGERLGVIGLKGSKL